MTNFDFTGVLPEWLFRVIFWRVDFVYKGTYERKVFFTYNSYRADYYERMYNGWKIHSLSNYGIITVWYYKPD